MERLSTIDEVETTTSTTTAAEPSSTTQTGREPLINQVEPDLRFDYGEIIRYERVDGVDWVWFDHYSFGKRQGSELESEPRWEMATDWHGGSSLNARLRTYPLASEARTLEVDIGLAACDDLNLTWDFIDSDISTLLANDSPTSTRSLSMRIIGSC